MLFYLAADINLTINWYLFITRKKKGTDIMINLRTPATIEIADDQLIMMADLVRRSLDASLKALFDSNVALAYRVIDNDKAINSYEIDIDNSTFNVLSQVSVLSQMPAEHLRTLLSIQKINATLERIGDHAVNIAESAITLANWGKNRDLFELPEMAKTCSAIFCDAIKSFNEKDARLAQEILGRDDQVDALNISITNTIKTKILCGDLGEMSLERGMELIRICKNLERIADLSTNIAEETSFTVLGVNVKHHGSEFQENNPDESKQNTGLVETVL
jgi:phosphate transport system protein